MSAGVAVYRVTREPNVTMDDVVDGMCSPFSCQCYHSVLPVLTQCCKIWRVTMCACRGVTAAWPPPRCAPYIPGTTDYDVDGVAFLRLRTYNDCQEDFELAINNKVRYYLPII